jgi:hypothetical protein
MTTKAELEQQLQKANLQMGRMKLSQKRARNQQQPKQSQKASQKKSQQTRQKKGAK